MIRCNSVADSKVWMEEVFNFKKRPLFFDWNARGLFSRGVFFMFTGIIEETGSVSVQKTSAGAKINVKCKTVLDGTKIGDSIAVNGVCLTVTSLENSSFTADVMAETLRRSNLGLLAAGDKVNLERAMSAEGRFGGHIVSGHIDGCGTIAKIQKEGIANWLYIRCDSKILNLIIEKGSITIDGVSLTVALVNDTEFAVSIIPHTASETTLLSKKIGDKVNLENDIVGKYVQKLMTVGAGVNGGTGVNCTAGGTGFGAGVNGGTGASQDDRDAKLIDWLKD